MEIRANKRVFKKLSKINKREDITITLDESIKEAVVMIHRDGSLIEWFKGNKLAVSYLKHGYLRIKKNCPYRIGKCICAKCSLYALHNGVGDCSLIWNDVNSNQMNTKIQSLINASSEILSRISTMTEGHNNG